MYMYIYLFIFYFIYFSTNTQAQRWGTKDDEDTKQDSTMHIRSYTCNYTIRNKDEWWHMTYEVSFKFEDQVILIVFSGLE